MVLVVVALVLLRYGVLRIAVGLVFVVALVVLLLRIGVLRIAVLLDVLRHVPSQGRVPAKVCFPVRLAAARSRRTSGWSQGLHAG